MRVPARFAVILALGVGSIVLLREPARALRREVLVENVLDVLCDALDARLARGDPLPQDSLLGGGELAAWLFAANDLAALPLNPDTGAPFGGIPLETDLVFYEPRRDGRGYRIEVLNAAGAEVVAVRTGGS